MPVDPAATPSTAPSTWNLPNALTTLRIALVPLFGWLLLSQHGGDTAHRLWACAVFCVAMWTDRLDGQLARSKHLVTDVGKLMDPIADKALTGMAFIGLSIIGELWWWVTVVVLTREWLITALRFWVLRYGVIAASRGGKLKTATQTLALVGLILPLREVGGSLHPAGVALWWAVIVVMAAAVVITVVTGVDYVQKALRVRRAGRATGGTW
jgi:CDP-diacylglycerol--glycerol-3-phosphate 3-phosphatidyltransferase